MFLLLACTEPSWVRSAPKPDDTATSPTNTTGTSGDTATTPPPEPCGVEGLETGLGPTPLELGARLALGAWADTPQLPELPTSTSDSGGPLLFSDSPETVSSPGLLYQDALSGAGRLYLYHATSQTLDLAVLVTALGADAELTVSARGVAGPWNDYLYVGRMGALRWEQERASPPAPELLQVPAGDTVLLAPPWTVPPDWLVHGIWDVAASAPVQISFVAVSEGEDPAAALPNLALSPRDAHDRGTFTPSERTRTGCVDTSRGTARVRLADGSASDGWAAGIDATTGLPEELGGNYGVHYTLDLEVRGDRPLALLMAPRGGPITGAAWINEHEVFDFPSDADQAEVGEAVMLGTWQPGERAVVRWTPAGASSLPVDLLAVPW